MPEIITGSPIGGKPIFDKIDKASVAELSLRMVSDTFSCMMLTAILGLGSCSSSERAFFILPAQLVHLMPLT